MSTSIASAILAHKFVLALLVGSVVVSGGAMAVENSANTVGTMSFTVNSSINVTSLADLNLGTLNPGQTASFSSSANVNFASTGNYTIFLTNEDMLRQVFSAFSVNVSGLTKTGDIMLSLDHPWQEFNVTGGSHSLGINVQVTVNNEMSHSVTVTKASFLGLSTYPPQEGYGQPQAEGHGESHGDDNGMGDDSSNRS